MNTEKKVIYKKKLLNIGNSGGFVIPKMLMEVLQLNNESEVEYMIDWTEKHQQFYLAIWNPKEITNKKK